MDADQRLSQSDDAVSGAKNGASIWNIMVGVFTRPTEAFAAFNRRPRIWIVLIVAIVFGLINNAVLIPYQGQMQLDMMSKSPIIPPQILEQQQQQLENPNYVLGTGLGVVGQVVVGIVVALIAWGLGSFIMGGESTFKKMWGATMLGGLISQVGALIKLPLIIAKGNIYVSFGLAALFPNKDFTSILYGLLYYFDAFMIWGVIVTGIGYAAVLNISRNRGTTIALLLSLLGFIIMMGATVLLLNLFAGVEITFF